MATQLFSGLPLSKRRLADRMRNLLNTAKLTAYVRLEHRLKAMGAEYTAATGQVDVMAAASVNYLFDEGPNQEHSQLDFNELQREAMIWLQSDPLIRELVVQSLRVSSMLSHMETGKATLKGEAILCDFGSSYPDAPDPDNYSHLVNRAIESLPCDDQSEVRKAFGLSK